MDEFNGIDETDCWFSEIDLLIGLRGMKRMRKIKIFYRVFKNLKKKKFKFLLFFLFKILILKNFIILEPTSFKNIFKNN